MTREEIAKVSNKFYIDMQIDEMLPLEEYEIYVKPDFETASWRFYNGKHQIVIGAGIFDNVIINVTQEQKLKYIRSFLYHELAHSKWTEKDLRLISDILKEYGYPF